MQKLTGTRDFIYVHMNHPGQFVISYGIEFSEFMKALPVRPANLLLLKHNFEDGHFNMHTMLDYADSEIYPKLYTDDVYGYGDFCWIDFEDEADLDQLSGQEIAELLYMGHFKEHLQSPFYRKISNNLVYLAGDDGWYNKTYYRSWNHFYTMLGVVISDKINLHKEKPFFLLRKKKDVPSIPDEILHSFISHMKEGITFGIDKAVRNRHHIEIPVWVIGDFYDMDAMLEEYELLNGRAPDGKIVFDRKTEEWQAFAKKAPSY